VATSEVGIALHIVPAINRSYSQVLALALKMTARCLLHETDQMTESGMLEREELKLGGPKRSRTGQETTSGPSAGPNRLGEKKQSCRLWREKRTTFESKHFSSDYKDPRSVNMRGGSIEKEGLFKLRSGFQHRRSIEYVGERILVNEIRLGAIRVNRRKLRVRG